MAEFRWILLGLGVLLIAGIWWWGMRRARQAVGNAQFRESAAAQAGAAQTGAAQTGAARTAAGPTAAAGRAMAQARASSSVPLEDEPDDGAYEAPSLPRRAWARPLDRETALDEFDVGATLQAHETRVPGEPTIAPESAPAPARVPTRAPPPAPAAPVTAAPAAPPAPVTAPPAAPAPAAAVSAVPAPVAAASAVPAPAAPATAPAALAPAPAAAPAAELKPEAARQSPPVSELQRIVTIRVAAAGDSRWPGSRLIAALELLGLTFGRYEVYHRKLDDGRSLFCVASLVEPGTFDLTRMPQQEFRGVTLFAVLPGPLEPLRTLNALFETAGALAEELSGVVQDHKGAVMSARGAVALREEVAQFQALLDR